MHDIRTGCGFSKEICRSMVAMLDLDRSGKLELEEFKLLFSEIMRWKVQLMAVFSTIQYYSYFLSTLRSSSSDQTTTTIKSTYVIFEKPSKPAAIN
jgi:hypothetical protein